MGLLDGVLQSVFSNAFSPIFLDGNVYVAIRTQLPGGRFSYAFSAAFPCKAVVVDASAEMQGEADYSEEQVQIIILQSGVGIQVLSADDEVDVALLPTLTQRYRVMNPIRVDPAAATWIFRGSPVTPRVNDDVMLPGLVVAGGGYFGGAYF